jgi:O-antigen/teichoic acid export membrane protein
LRELAPEGVWSAFGGGIHWLFSQGYSYLVAAMLDVKVVAALAATRLLVMPIFLLSTGVGTLMLPTVSKWTHDRPASSVLRRLALFSIALGGAACCYLAIMWLGRSWIFASILKKSFPNVDSLLLVWSGIAVITVFRDQMLYFLVTRARFQQSSTLTFVSAVLSLSISFATISRVGAIGALIGLLAGELFNMLGIVALSLREARRSPGSLPAAARP